MRYMKPKIVGGYSNPYLQYVNPENASTSSIYGFMRGIDKVLSDELYKDEGKEGESLFANLLPCDGDNEITLGDNEILIVGLG